MTLTEGVVTIVLIVGFLCFLSACINLGCNIGDRIKGKSKEEKDTPKKKKAGFLDFFSF